MVTYNKLVSKVNDSALIWLFVKLVLVSDLNFTCDTTVSEKDRYTERCH